ncbi:hypothetical protein QOT17_011468 [Balamuthia mandrillaris]
MAQFNRNSFQRNIAREGRALKSIPFGAPPATSTTSEPKKSPSGFHQQLTTGGRLPAAPTQRKQRRASHGTTSSRESQPWSNPPAGWSSFHNQPKTARTTRSSSHSRAAFNPMPAPTLDFTSTPPSSQTSINASNHNNPQPLPLPLAGNNNNRNVGAWSSFSSSSAASTVVPTSATTTTKYNHWQNPSNGSNNNLVNNNSTHRPTDFIASSSSSSLFPSSSQSKPPEVVTILDDDENEEDAYPATSGYNNSSPTPSGFFTIASLQPAAQLHQPSATIPSHKPEQPPTTFTTTVNDYAQQNAPTTSQWLSSRSRAPAPSAAPAPMTGEALENKLTTAQQSAFTRRPMPTTTEPPASHLPPSHQYFPQNHHPTSYQSSSFRDQPTAASIEKNNMASSLSFLDTEDNMMWLEDAAAALAKPPPTTSSGTTTPKKGSHHETPIKKTKVLDMLDAETLNHVAETMSTVSSLPASSPPVNSSSSGVMSPVLPPPPAFSAHSTDTLQQEILALEEALQQKRRALNSMLSNKKEQPVVNLVSASVDPMCSSQASGRADEDMLKHSQSRGRYLFGSNATMQHFLDLLDPEIMSPSTATYQQRYYKAFRTELHQAIFAVFQDDEPWSHLLPILLSVLSQVVSPQQEGEEDHQEREQERDKGKEKEKEKEKEEDRTAPSSASISLLEKRMAPPPALIHNLLLLLHQLLMLDKNCRWATLCRHCYTSFALGMEPEEETKDGDDLVSQILNNPRLSFGLSDKEKEVYNPPEASPMEEDKSDPDSSSSRASQCFFSAPTLPSATKQPQDPEEGSPLLPKVSPMFQTLTRLLWRCFSDRPPFLAVVLQLMDTALWECPPQRVYRVLPLFKKEPLQLLLSSGQSFDVKNAALSLFTHLMQSSDFLSCLSVISLESTACTTLLERIIKLLTSAKLGTVEQTQILRKKAIRLLSLIAVQHKEGIAALLQGEEQQVGMEENGDGGGEDHHLPQQHHLPTNRKAAVNLISGLASLLAEEVDRLDRIPLPFSRVELEEHEAAEQEDTEELKDKKEVEEAEKEMVEASAALVYEASYLFLLLSYHLQDHFMSYMPYVRHWFGSTVHRLAAVRRVHPALRQRSKLCEIVTVLREEIQAWN